MNAWWKAYREVIAEGIVLALMVTGVASLLLSHWHIAASCFLWGWIIDSSGKRPRLRKNQAIVTAAVEPSSDMRQAARAMTEVRAALMEAGYTSEQAAQQIAAMIAAERGAS